MSLRNIIIPDEYDPAFFQELLTLMANTLELEDYLGETLIPGNGWSTGTTVRLIQLNEHMFMLAGSITGGTADAVNPVLTLPSIELRADIEVVLKGTSSYAIALIDTTGQLFITVDGGGSTVVNFGHLIIVNGA